MYLKLLTALALGALVSSAALAQNTQTASTKGEWQASKFIHMNVYNAKNEKIGDIKELLLDKSGKIETVAIAVGGFLGVGERDVAVKFDQLKWVNEPPKSSSTTGSSQSQGARKQNYPDHAVFNATKDQLKSMPQFDYSK